MAENEYARAFKAHERVKYNLEHDIKKYAPYIPEIQILLIPPKKGSYCNADYAFCPYLLWGGFCQKLNVRLQAVDGKQFTTITSEQFWKAFDKEQKNKTKHYVAVGCYKVFKRICGREKV